MTTIINLTSHRVDVRRGGECYHCKRSDFHREGCIVAVKLDRDAADAARKSASVPPRVRSELRYVNVGQNVMQGASCKAVATSASFARTIAVALNNRQAARDRTARREEFMQDWMDGEVSLWGWSVDDVKAALRMYQAQGCKESVS